MAIVFYNIFLLLYKTGIRIAALWNAKARQWIEGREKIFERIASEIRPYNSDNIWVHCSSLGEFEQGRPVIEKLRSHHPQSRILLTFFSPSGYEIRKDYKGADWVFYLPMDSAQNAKRFLDIVKPQLVIFVKYDYWYYYLVECKKRNIALFMVSAIFRNKQPFFKWYGGLHSKMLKCFTHLFVQDKESSDLLKSIGINNVTVSGDTRFDRVIEIANNFIPIKIIEQFCGQSKIIVAGSTWPSDEIILETVLKEIDDRNLKLIIAPHEINEKHLAEIKNLFPGALWFSNYIDSTPTMNEFAWSMLAKASNVLIIDNIGMLSRLYHYATITYIGGGFDKGIHNTLEAAVYGKPVIFGPNYKKFKEAIGLIETGGGISINSTNELTSHLKNLLSDQKKLEDTSKRSFGFVQQNKGATEIIMKMI